MTKEEKTLRIKHLKNTNNKASYKKGVIVLSLGYLFIFIGGLIIVLVLSDFMNRSGVDLTYRILITIGLVITNIGFSYGLYQLFQEINNRRYIKNEKNPPTVKNKWLVAIASFIVTSGIFAIIFKIGFYKIADYFLSQAGFTPIIFICVLAYIIGLFLMIAIMIDIDVLCNKLYQEAQLCRTDHVNEILEICKKTSSPQTIKKQLNKRVIIEPYIDALVVERLLIVQEKGYAVNPNMTTSEKEFLEEVRGYK